MPKRQTVNQYKYDSTHCRTFRIKLNLTIDADIIEKLTAQESMQGYIKQLIREDIARTRTHNYSDPEWQTIVNLMDDEIRESVHADLAPCRDIDFLKEYMKRHKEKYGEDFTW